jgi:hypothetical protein
MDEALDELVDTVSGRPSCRWRRREGEWIPNWSSESERAAVLADAFWW